jgi:hypothetical protein
MHVVGKGEVLMAEPSVIVQAEFSVKIPLEERRNAVRYFCPCPHPIRLLVRPGLASAKGIITDISASGIGLILDRPVKPGAMLALHLGRDERPSLIQSGRVVHARPLPDGAWAVGCEFALPLVDKDLEGLVKGTVAAAKS